jgi:selenocysteine lyase/cysteine desulfurase
MFDTLFKRRDKVVASEGLAYDSKGLVHDEFFESLRKKEYARLDEEGHVYLDYTGGNLYGKSQIDQHFQSLQHNTFGNPHSINPTSSLATEKVEKARQKVLDFFNANDYLCIFTPNASGALKIVGECYPFDDNAEFALLTDNHNSVNGIREYAKARNSKVTYVPVNDSDLKVNEQVLLEKLSVQSTGNKLFAFPAQSNVSGVKHDLKWIEIAQSKGWNVMLDAAAFVPSNPLDLQKIQPDFVSISFYKIFGFPTGIGCLLVKKDSFDLLQKRWFAGGNVSFVSVKRTSHYFQNDHERFENGTINYLDIPAIQVGLEFIESVGMKRIQERVASMSDYLCSELDNCTHSNGEKIVRRLGCQDRVSHGGTIILSFVNPNGCLVEFEKIEALASEHGISLRAGCFCNPGLDEVNSCVGEESLKVNITRISQIGVDSVLPEVKRARGAIRVSVGIATVKKDLDTFLDFVRSLQNTTI